MGNCLKSQGSDDISLLQGGSDGNPAHQQSRSESYSSASPMNESQDHLPFYYPPPEGSHGNQVNEENQIRIAKRIGLIQNLPTGLYDGCKKNQESVSLDSICTCIICMVEFALEDPVRYLPCMHTYHKKCIDDWLMRRLACPSCLEPVDAALLSTFDTS
ncbi:unnamed protein product [Notodromas monacha]|uniref:RING-type domain-containing protein n=1 Tax=Notodromas monacha TaxID=399045 RepID=A0A7R9GCQ3_9CRUS|nr:unnamed protein product [Notodromas monacha]CAG0916097.1 unnamed protein product [Notodromas monacha]